MTCVEASSVSPGVNSNSECALFIMPVMLDN